MSQIYGMRTRILPLLISLVIAPQLFAQSAVSKFPSIFKSQTPTIATDKSNYQTNEIVDIAGVDFLGYERVRLSAKYLDLNLKQEVLLLTWDAFADSKGRISSDWIVFDVNGAGTQFFIEGKGTISGFGSKVEITNAPESGESIRHVYQCANGPGLPQGQTCPEPAGNSGWVNGNVNEAKAQYFEGDSLPYRIILEDLDVGDIYRYSFDLDASKGGLNALDYVTTYNRSISMANPCRDGANASFFCTLASPTSTIAVPIDTNVTNGRDKTAATSDDITQIPGVFTMWGGEMNEATANCTAAVGTPCGVTAPVYSGPIWVGDESARHTITFKATATTMVLAFGGHISTRSDWGESFGSVNISGSPYHLSNANGDNLSEGTTGIFGGNREVQLTVTAVTPTASITIVKQAAPPNEFQAFGFTASGGLAPASFSLLDDDADGIANNIVGTDPTFNPSQSYPNISAFGTYTFTESTFGSFDILSLTCLTDSGTPAHVVNLVTRSVDVTVASGDAITCTWVNTIVTAAAVSVSGTVYDDVGRGLSRASVTVTNSRGIRRTVFTNQFGYYTISDIDAGAGYIFDVRHKGYTFPTRYLSVNSTVKGVDFIAQ